MNRHDLERLVERIAGELTYRDGWRFVAQRTLAALPAGPPTILVEWIVPDVRGGSPTRLAGFVSVSELDVEVLGLETAIARLLLDVWRVVEQLEGHERLELLRFRERPLWNPHPGWPEQRELEWRPPASAIEKLPRRVLEALAEVQL